MRIIADHTRGAVNLIADGVVPSNEERGYVLRRIMRRAIQQGRVLGLEAPWLGRFAERVIEGMSGAYPHLEEERDNVMRWVNDEEESFGHTLDRGTELLAKLVADAKRLEHLVDRRRGRVSPSRHLRLPVRPDQGAARRGGARGRRRRLRGADGGPARRAHVPAGSTRRPTATSESSRSRRRRRRPSSSATASWSRARAWSRPRIWATALRLSSSRRAPSTRRAAARSPTAA